MIAGLDSIADRSRYDVIVAGAGGGGLAAALFAAIEGLRVLLVESTELIGGTAAFSAGSVWAPNTRHAAGSGDSPEQARAFLDRVVGNHARAELRNAFLDSAPAAIACLEQQSDVQFRPYALHPDYVQEVEGATLRGRALEPVPFDGRRLGSAFRHLRPPIPEFTILGGMMVDRTDIRHLLGMRRSLASARYAASILARHGLDRLTHRRGTRLVMGNALVGRFLASLEARKVPILLSTTVAEIAESGGRIGGVVLVSGASRRRVDCAALVLAGGGFAGHPERRRALLHKPVPDQSPVAPGVTGALQDLAIVLGARISEGQADNAYWTPVSLRRRADGSTAVFPHFVLDRSKPGTVAVGRNGRRFVNEAASYHEFARAMFEADARSSTIPAFLIADARAVQKYGLGMVRPGGLGLKRCVAEGYLTEAPTLAELAARLGIDAAALQSTVADMNGYARTGVDREFGRGTTAYHHVNGDADVKPNPNLGPIATPPYYAVRLHPAEIGTAAGLVCSPDAEVLGPDDRPIPGLYAVGNDMQSVMGGTYPGPGITLGPAIVFGYRAARHIASRRRRPATDRAHDPA